MSQVLASAVSMSERRFLRAFSCARIDPPTPRDRDALPCACRSRRDVVQTSILLRARHARERSVTELILAYIDPGSGSLIIQVVIASLVAIPIFFRTQIGRLVHLARGRREVESPVDDRVERD
jgi:hypothetical protein